ncbi:hypothetical protein M153_1100068687 [Pseudoloma neurophilia]|uniref:Uncharacterized protein n=1 Tax=Pseudoloma neurophilia TaxID=146866 RepID=A0A0R0M6V5_9MICR|nr:hypothetical protein M153_1100068687 [Pseudoloma neurophilia]
MHFKKIFPLAIFICQLFAVKDLIQTQNLTNKDEQSMINGIPLYKFFERGLECLFLPEVIFTPMLIYYQSSSTLEFIVVTIMAYIFHSLVMCWFCFFFVLKSTLQ